MTPKTDKFPADAGLEGRVAIRSRPLGWTKSGRPPKAMPNRRDQIRTLPSFQQVQKTGAAKDLAGMESIRRQADKQG